MACSRRRILACIACVSERCNAIDTLCRNHVHNKLTEGPDPAHSLDADVAHSTKNRSDLQCRFGKLVFFKDCCVKNVKIVL